MKNKRKSGLKWILAVWFCGISAMADAQVTEGLKAIGMENIRCAQTPGMTTVSCENNVYRSTYTGVSKAIDDCLGTVRNGRCHRCLCHNPGRRVVYRQKTAYQCLAECFVLRTTPQLAVRL